MEQESAAGGCEKRDLSVSMTAANVYVLITTAPVTLVLGVVYVALWGFGGLADVSFSRAVLLGVLVAGIAVHEAIHGLSWAFFGGKPLRAVKFGFQLKSLTPYAHLEEPVDVRAYRLGVAAPGMVMGLLPVIFGILTGNAPVTLFGLFFTFAAGGDALILWLIRKVDSTALVEDHPTRAGCYVLEEPA